MTRSSSPGIFLNYRRQDAAPYARLLQMELRERLPEAPVFLDLDSIEAGRDFADVIQDAVDSCGVLVALIGRHWVTLTDEDGQRRLDSPDDYVRFEIQAALERGVRVIPVLVDGAKPPKQQQLPPDLRKLARLNALELSYGRYRHDADRLFELIQQVLAEASRTDTPLAEVAEELSAADHAERIAQTDSQPVQDSRPRQVRIFDKALAAAQSIDAAAKWKSLALARLAAAVAATDPDCAERLLSDAERIAQSTRFEDWKADALAHLGRMVVATEPDRAERLAVAAVRALQSIPDRGMRRNYLVTLAGELATVDPDLAERAARSVLEEDSEELAEARSLSTATYDGVRAVQMAREDGKEKALARIAGAVAGTDPDRAERIAESITTYRYYKGDALARIAEAVVGFDPERAERISELIVEDYSNDGPLMALTAGAMAAVDPDRAEQIAGKITDRHWKSTALTRIATAIAAVDSDRAERIAESITYDIAKAEAFAGIAETIPPADRD